MPAISISENVFHVGIQDPNRKMFDCVMPTPHGTSYNSYIVRGRDKTALIDTVESAFFEEYLLKLKSVRVDTIDYIVILHTEQDHSGSIHKLLKRYPDAKLVGTTNVAKLMRTHQHISEDRFLIVEEGDVLELGEMSLTFMKIPFAHWPDNTMAFIKESGVLFSSDLFGSHYASERIFATDSYEIKAAALAYYAEIMMPFSPQVKKYAEKVIELKPRMIAPAHGPVWNNPAVVVNKYLTWTSDKVTKTVVIPYVSMHESTALIVDRLTLRLAGRGLSVICRNLGESPESLTVESGHVMVDLAMAAAVVFGIPTVLGGPHPSAAYCAILANALRPKTRFIGMVGSYGWGTKVCETFDSLTSGFKKAKRLTPLLIEGLPTQEDLEKVDAFADELTDMILAME